MNSIRKSDGFEGQRAIVLPKKIKEICAYTPPLNSQYITDIGFYPRAKFHYREREEGVSQNILIYCVEGLGWIDFPNQSYQVKPFEYLIIPADTPHKYGADINNPWSIYWLHFKGIQAPYYASLLSKNGSAMVGYCGFSEERNELFEKMYKAYEKGYDIDNLLFNSISLPYYLGMFCFYDKFLPHTENLIEPLVNIVDKAIEIMQKNLDKSMSLKELTQEVNLSVPHFSSVFKKKTGHSPIEYFNHLKIQRACQCLQFSTLRINEISSKVGISDAYYFSRIFTKIMGMTPSEYRSKKH